MVMMHTRGDVVARKAAPIGPIAFRLIEDAPIDLVRAVLAAKESENEPDLGLTESAGEAGEDEGRKAILDNLSRFDQDELRPLEERCQRIFQLSQGKGTSSLDTVADQRLGGEEHGRYLAQLDSLCRSIWTYLNFHQVFEDAESFHAARRFRDYGRLYDAFEVDLDDEVVLDAASVDIDQLAAKITEALQLKTACTVRGVDLPVTEHHPASVMLIVRHGGPLSSVHDHRADGRRGTIYFRPPNEATLIYTPGNRQIEICADSPVVRQKVSACFAGVALGHDVSKKPLTWKRYDLSRFRSSLRLPLPPIDGFEILLARVLDIEVRLGDWRRKLSLKVTIDDEIDEVAARYLGKNSVVRRAEGFSRVSIAVRYHRVGREEERTLNITISGSKACNLQSNKDPEQRSLGFALLDVWKIMRAFKQIGTTDLRAMFPRLVQLFDRAEDEITGRFLREVGLDPNRLIEGGLLEPRGRQKIVLIDEEQDAEGEVSFDPSSTFGMAKATGLFGEDLGERAIADLKVYQLNPQWLHDSLVALIKPLLSSRVLQILDEDLTLLGSMQIDGGDVPIYFARRLDDQKVTSRLDLLLRARGNSGFGIVLSASPELPSCLGPNVVVPFLTHLSSGGDEPILSPRSIELAFRSGRSLAMGGSSPAIHRYAAQSATLYVPGKPPLSLVGANQIRLFERLVEAHIAGSPDVKSSTLTEGFDSRSPQHCFRAEMWGSILNEYIAKGVKKGYWRLVV